MKMVSLFVPYLHYGRLQIGMQTCTNGDNFTCFLGVFLPGFYVKMCEVGGKKGKKWGKIATSVGQLADP